MTCPTFQISRNSARKLNSSVAELRFQRGRRALRYEGRISPCALRQLNICSTHRNVYSFKLNE